MTRATSKREHRLQDALRLRKLAAMLQNTLRRYPRARLISTRGVFGALLGGSDSLHIVYNGDLSTEDIRDLLALFATWCAVDPDTIVTPPTALPGASLTAAVESYSSSGRQDSPTKRRPRQAGETAPAFASAARTLEPQDTST